MYSNVVEGAGLIRLRMKGNETHLNTCGHLERSLEFAILELLNRKVFVTVFRVCEEGGCTAFAGNSECTVASDVDINVRVLEPRKLKERSDMSRCGRLAYLHPKQSSAVGRCSLI